MTKKRKRCGIAALLVALLLLLAACQAELEEEAAATSLLTTAMTTTAEPTTQEETLPERREPTKEDFIEVLEALKLAFAAGEYQAFADKYPRPRIEESEETYIESNKWPSLLKGVTAEMSYRPDDVDISDLSYCWVQASLKVHNGNQYLPSGNQTVNLRLATNDNAATLYSIMLITDGRLVDTYTRPASSMEDKIYYLTDKICIWEWRLFRTMLFMDTFEQGEKTARTAKVITAGAKKYLGIDRYVPNIDETNEVIEYDKEYNAFMWGGTGFANFDILNSVLVLKKPSQGDITCRAFIYANGFLLELKETRDYNYRILENPDGTPYAQLLSVQTVTQP